MQLYVIKQEKRFKMKKYDCKNYKRCLEISLNSDFKEFTCEGCDETTIIAGNKENQKKNKKKERSGIKNSRTVNLDFIQHPELQEALNREAKKCFRSFNMQVLYWCYKGYEISKGKHDKI